VTLIGLTLLVSLTFVLLTIATLTLVWMLDAWRTPVANEETGFVPMREPHVSFSLIVPARHEQAVLGETLDRMATLDHPDYEVLVVVGHDDTETEAVAREAAERHPKHIRVVIDHNWPKNKPKALNTALPRCRGDIVGVFDAEDEVSPLLLGRIDSYFRDPDIAVVQGGVQLMNFRSSWWALRNVLEYYFYFRSRLHHHARAQCIPLGGNTVFFRRLVLVENRGWDEDCLAEDCEVGLRLSAQGHRVAVAYAPELVTREETPHRIGALLKQRTRWNQGFLQVLAKGEWRKLPMRRQRVLAWFMLITPFLQASSGVLIPIAVASVLLLDAPVPVALLMFTPLVIMAVTLAVESAGLAEFGSTFHERIRIRDHIRLVLGLFPYQWLMAAAAVRAVIRHLRSDNSWEKTTHVGAHRVAGVPGLAGGAATLDETPEEVAS
jgi:cellulose synthase/poly-beta-1,6-N-acetylglucosamine synthase-like glycosyltransferase